MYLTEHLDIAYAHTRDNIARLVRALKPLNPKLRGPGSNEGVPFPFDEHTLYNGGNFTLVTDEGNVDILAHVGGFFNYEELNALSVPMSLSPGDARVLSIEGLIRAKKAANRAKDQPALAELELLLEAQRRQKEIGEG